MQLKGSQASQESKGKGRMHLNFLASQIDASRTEESCITVYILLFEASQTNNGCSQVGAKLQTK